MGTRHNGSGDIAVLICERCDLRGGPFGAAEAEHLMAVHDQSSSRRNRLQTLPHQTLLPERETTAGA